MQDTFKWYRFNPKVHIIFAIVNYIKLSIRLIHSALEQTYKINTISLLYFLFSIFILEKWWKNSCVNIKFLECTHDVERRRPAFLSDRAFIDKCLLNRFPQISLFCFFFNTSIVAFILCITSVSVCSGASEKWTITVLCANICDLDIYIETQNTLCEWV